MVWPFNKGDGIKESKSCNSFENDEGPQTITENNKDGTSDYAANAEEEELKKIFQQLANEDILQEQQVEKPQEQTKSTRFRTGIDDDESYPTQMSCTQAFEELMKCYSFTGQMRNYYRYGDIRNCSDRRSQMKFCLYTKFVPKKRRPSVIQDWYRQRQTDIATTYGSSQQVWNLRRTKLHDPFLEDWSHLDDEKKP